MKKGKQFRAVATQDNAFLILERATNTRIAVCVTSPYASLEDTIELAEAILDAYDKYYKAIHTINRA